MPRRRQARRHPSGAVGRPEPRPGLDEPPRARRTPSRARRPWRRRASGPRRRRRAGRRRRRPSCRSRTTPAGFFAVVLQRDLQRGRVEAVGRGAPGASTNPRPRARRPRTARPGPCSCRGPWRRARCASTCRRRRRPLSLLGASAGTRASRRRPPRRSPRPRRSRPREALGAQLAHALGEVVHERAGDDRHQAGRPPRARGSAWRRWRGRPISSVASRRPASARVTVRAGGSRPNVLQVLRLLRRHRLHAQAFERARAGRPPTSGRRGCQRLGERPLALPSLGQRVAALGPRDLERLHRVALDVQQVAVAQVERLLVEERRRRDAAMVKTRGWSRASRRRRCRPGVLAPSSSVSGWRALERTRHRVARRARGRTARGRSALAATTSSISRPPGS